jgi:hypothetical protein
LRKDHLILSTTAYWHKNNQINTKTKHQHAPKKHIRKNPLHSASAVKQEGGGIGAGHPSTASEVDPLSVPPLSISSLINIGTGIYPTQPYNNQPETFRTIKRCYQCKHESFFCATFDQQSSWNKDKTYNNKASSNGDAVSGCSANDAKEEEFAVDAPKFSQAPHVHEI